MSEQTPPTEVSEPQDAATQESVAPARVCRSCQAPLAADQEWCLNCGRAVAGSRFGRLPGMRAAGTVAALTFALTGGAVAASYAALSSDGTPPAPTTQVAQIPATTTTTAPAPTTPPATATTPTVPTTSGDSGSTSVPSLPDLSSIPSTPTPSGSSSSSSSSSSGSSSSSSGSTGSSSHSSTGSGSTSTSTGSSTSTTKTTTSTTRSDTTTGPTPIKLSASALQTYDPYTRVTDQGDVANLLDGDATTSWWLTVADGSPEINAGLVVDLGKLRGVRELDLVTKTPGFKTEIYATDSADLPPDVLDTRWAHLKDVGKIGTSGDGAQSISLGAGSTKYRYVLLWFTKLPSQGTTVRLASLKVLG